jgi:2-iminobutanoate/2-iminopropanoate deaminase
MPVARETLHVPESMCEAYDYDIPSAFSRGMSVTLGGARFIFVSGTASVGPRGESLFPGNFSAQARRAFENARAVLQSAGGDWKDVVKTTIYIKDIQRHYDEFNIVRCAYFGEMGIMPYPASTCIEARLCRDDLLVEMDMIAVVKDQGAECAAHRGNQ